MKLTLYLPDALGAQAKKAGLNLSGLLRAAVERDLRGEKSPPARRIAGASVTTREAPGGVEVVVFVPDGTLPAPKP